MQTRTRTPPFDAWVALCLAAVAGTFARALPFPLQHSWDDDRFITDNPLVHGVSLANLRAIFADAHFQAYHPLHLLSYWIDVPLLGDSATALHATSLALWLLAAFLLLQVMRGLGLSKPAASVATLLCALHPVQVEAVSWATGRKDVLAMGMACGAVLCHLRSERATDRWAWGSRAVYGLGLLAKTTLVPLPAVLLLWDLHARRRSPGAALAMQLPSLLIAGMAAPAVLQIWQDNEMVRATVGGPELAPIRFANTLAHQLKTAVWPASVAPMYASEPLTEVSWRTATAPLLVLGGWLWARRAGRADVQWSLGAFVLLLLPVSNVVPMYFPFQDRYLSLPLLPLCFGAGAVLDAVAAPGQRSDAPRPAHIVGLVLVTALAGRTIEYQAQWSSEMRLWGHAVQVQPRAYYAWMKLGETRRNAGQFDGAIRAYRRLLMLDPTRKVGHAALLQTVALRDEAVFGLRPSRAEAYAARYYQQMASPDALLTLSGEMLRTGHLRSIEIASGRALALKPLPEDALRKAARAHFEAGRPSLGLFYLRQLRTPTDDTALVAHRQRALSQVTDLQLPYALAIPEP